MTHTDHKSNGFKLGVPTLSAREREPVLDPQATRAIEETAELFSTVRFAIPVEGGDNKRYAEWLDGLRKLIGDPFLQTPDTPNRYPNDAISLDLLLSRAGEIGRMTRVQRLLKDMSLPLNERSILNEDVFFNFLYAMAVYLVELTEDEAIADWLTDSDGNTGAQLFYPFILELAAQNYVERKRVETDTDAEEGPDFEWNTYLLTVGPATNFSFASGAFRESLTEFIEDFTFRREPIFQVDQAIASLAISVSPEERTHLQSYFDGDGPALTDSNRDSLVSSALLNYRSRTTHSIELASTATTPLDYAVVYHKEPRDSSAVDRSNVHCAAQLFYVMVIGDQLGGYHAANLLLEKSRNRDRSGRPFNPRSAGLLKALHQYGYEYEFPVPGADNSTRTREEDRLMFYRQVFDYGSTEIFGQASHNQTFSTLWDSLMVETVRYIEKVERSDRPAEYVSRIPLGRVIEDLQYNLSSQTFGLAKAMAPVMYNELDFIIRRLFSEPEVVQQFGQTNSTSYWRAVENLLQEDRGSSIATTSLVSKAIYGHQILTAVAEYDGASIADDAKFSSLVSHVEAFIIASEQAEDSARSLFGNSNNPAADPMADYGAIPGMNGSPVGVPAGFGGADDWSF